MTDSAADKEPGEAEEVVWAYHGLVMNGGIAHALEVGVDPRRSDDDVVAAFRLLGLEDLAALIQRVVDDEKGDEAATDEWSDVIPVDAVLEDRLRAGRRSPRHDGTAGGVP